MSGTATVSSNYLDFTWWNRCAGFDCVTGWQQMEAHLFQLPHAAWAWVPFWNERNKLSCVPFRLHFQPSSLKVDLVLVWLEYLVLTSLNRARRRYRNFISRPRSCFIFDCSFNLASSALKRTLTAAPLAAMWKLHWDTTVGDRNYKTCGKTSFFICRSIFNALLVKVGDTHVELQTYPNGILALMPFYCSIFAWVKSQIRQIAKIEEMIQRRLTDSFAYMYWNPSHFCPFFFLKQIWYNYYPSEYSQTILMCMYSSRQHALKCIEFFSTEAGLGT